MSDFLEFIAELVLEIFGEAIDSKKVHPVIRILLFSLVMLPLIAIAVIPAINLLHSPEENVSGIIILAIISLVLIALYIAMLVKILKK